MDFKEFEEKCKGCENCALAKTRTNIVVSRGCENAPIMFVGEAPGQTEDEIGKPFVGLAGKLLDKYLTAIGFEEQDYYICNILKCRPPHNRDPLPEEIEKCMELLRLQTKLVKPKIIVCLGRIAACTLIDSNFKMGSDHGKWVKKGSFVMCGVYHPSAILRDESKREVMYTDLENVKKMLDSVK